MNIKQNPFSVYDFLGYFTPGAIFLYVITFGYAHVNEDISPQDYVTENLGFDNAEIYIPFILVSYAIGHLLSFLSSISIESFSIWAHGYPSKCLLKMQTDGYFQTEGSKTLKIIIGLFLLPISVYELILGHCCGLKSFYMKPLDRVLRVVIVKKINLLLIEHGGVKQPGNFGSPEKTDFFRYAYHYAVEFAPNHYPKMQNYVALFGFLRTLAFLSILIFWGLVFHVLNEKCSIFDSIVWLICSGTIGFIFYLSFLKFYRRFSLEALMALAVSYKETK